MAFRKLKQRLRLAREQKQIRKALPQIDHDAYERALTISTQPEVYERLVQGVAYVHSTGVEGHLAEFGTMSGRTATVLARALDYFSRQLRYSDEAHDLKERQLHLFDSFEGLPETSSEIDTKSPHVESGVWSAGTCQGISKEQLAAMCGQFLPPERVVMHEGWFSETLPKMPDQKFALLHIDCDLYESTRDVLEQFASRKMFADGCVVFFDDWNCNRASPEFGERRAWNECCEKYGIGFSDGGDYGIVGHKFIIHQPH